MNDQAELNLRAVILARLEDKSDHEYRWPRWAASEEAAAAVFASGWLAETVRAAADAEYPEHGGSMRPHSYAVDCQRCGALRVAARLG